MSEPQRSAGKDVGRVIHVVADPDCDLHQEWPTKPDESARCETCRALASVYADAPGFREEWR